MDSSFPVFFKQISNRQNQMNSNKNIEEILKYQNNECGIAINNENKLVLNN